MNKLLTLLTTSAIALSAATFNVATTSEFRDALTASANNGDNDIIILSDGVYKTTDDNSGTFIYLSNEENNLTIKGSDAKNVILSGGHTEQIFNHQSSKDAFMTIENLSFVDGNNSSDNGGGLYTDYSLEVQNCIFKNNSAERLGGGFYSEKKVTVTNSKFSNNNSTLHGGGFCSGYDVTVTNSIFSNNSCGHLGAGFRSGRGAKVTASTFNDNSGSGFSTITDSSVSNSIFTNNSGRGFSSGSRAKVTNSIFTANSGGGFYSHDPATVTNSTFNDNSGSYGGGFSSSSTATVTNSKFSNNDSTLGGGGFYSNSSATVTNSIFSNNSGRDGGGFSANSSATVTNSIFSNNSGRDGGGFSAKYVYATGLLLKENSNGLFIKAGEHNFIVNSIFLNNNISDMNASSDVVINHLENNYLDTSKTTVASIKKNNIFDGVNLGFVDEGNGDYNLTASSDLIDVGNANIDGVSYPATDLNGNARIVGGNIDIGPYEFSTTRPTINSISYSGEAKEETPLTFTTDYTLTEGRAVSKVEYDYENNKTWTTIDTHTYNKKGVYPINVKVTDNQGEFSSTTKTVTIAELPYNEMTDEQKLKKAIDPAYYDDIIAVIDAEKDASNASGVTMGENNVVLDPNAYGLHTQEELDLAISDTNASAFEAGKQYVQNNLTEFNLVTLANMKKAIDDTNSTAITAGIATGKQYVQNNLEEFNLFDRADIELTSSTISGFSSGWTLTSTPFAITDLSIFDSAKIIWVYNNSSAKWDAYSSDATMKQKIINSSKVDLITTIPSGSGIWVQK